ncbi:MAG: VanZ family protein [Nocardioides sp.]
MSDQATNALIAVALGSALAVLLFVPTAAVQYRRNGTLGPSDLATLLAAAVYGLALWTYTLLPMPASDSYVCKSSNLDPLGSIRELWAGDLGGGSASLLRDPVFLQIALNVLLFVPLGFFLRTILKRGVVVAALVGSTVSLLIETTQLTGVWSLYDCAYRLFDVDDVFVNTAGAVVGSLLSALFVSRRAHALPVPTSLTIGRRLVGMLSDLLFVVLFGGLVALSYRAAAVYGPLSLDLDVQTTLQVALPYAVQAVSVLGAGRTIGEWTISVRAVPRRSSLNRWEPLARIVKLLTGITPPVVFFLLGGWWALLGIPAFLTLTVLAAFLTRQRRGLSHSLAGLDLRIAWDEHLRRDGEPTVAESLVEPGAKPHERKGDR